MECFDSKVLESFLIPEYEIATEGFINNFINKIIDIFKFIGRLIMTLINKIKAKFKKSKEESKNTNSENKSTSSANKFISFNTERFYDAIKNKDYKVLKTNAYSALMMELGYGTGEFDRVINILKKEIPDIFEPYEKGDYEFHTSNRKEWTQSYYVKLAYYFQQNFALSRIPELKEVGNFIKNSPKMREYDKFGKLTSIDKYDDFIRLFQQLKDLEKLFGSFLSKSVEDAKYSTEFFDIDHDLSRIEDGIDHFEELFEHCKNDKSKSCIKLTNARYSKDEFIKNLETLKENNDKIINKLEVHSKNLTNQAKTVGSDKDYTKIVKYATEYSKLISNTIALFNEYEIQYV